MVSNYKTSPKVKNIVLCIGTNNNFRTGNIKQLFKAVKKTFPNATIYVIKGSWGWGNNDKITPKEVNAYYDMFQKIGFVGTATAIGDMTLYSKKYANAPHNAGIPTYAAIGKEVDNLLK